jgi:hypothetical protein
MTVTSRSPTLFPNHLKQPTCECPCISIMHRYYWHWNVDRKSIIHYLKLLQQPSEQFCGCQPGPQTHTFSSPSHNLMCIEYITRVPHSLYIKLHTLCILWNAEHAMFTHVSQACWRHTGSDREDIRNNNRFYQVQHCRHTYMASANAYCATALLTSLVC